MARGPTAEVEQQDITNLRQAVERQTRVLEQIRDLLIWEYRGDPMDDSLVALIVEARHKRKRAALPAAEREPTT